MHSKNTRTWQHNGVRPETQAGRVQLLYLCRGIRRPHYIPLTGSMELLLQSLQQYPLHLRPVKGQSSPVKPA